MSKKTMPLCCNIQELVIFAERADRSLTFHRAGTRNTRYSKGAKGPLQITLSVRMCVYMYISKHLPMYVQVNITTHKCTNKKSAPIEERKYNFQEIMTDR